MMCESGAELGLAHLSKYEIAFPQRVIAHFFEFNKLSEVKETFAEVKRAVVEKKFDFGDESKEEDDMLCFFERMEKLMEGVYLMK